MTPQAPSTLRQQLLALLIEDWHSSRKLATRLGISERAVEFHLSHVRQSLSRNSRQQFAMDPSRCHRCGFHFRERIRLTRPGRCPRCRNEDISSPRFRVITPYSHSGKIRTSQKDSKHAREFTEIGSGLRQENNTA